MQTVKDLLTSKKFIAMLAGIAVTLAAKRGLNLDPDMTNQIVYLIISYIVGQGIADHGKEAAKVTAAGPPAAPQAAAVVNLATPAAAFALLLMAGLLAHGCSGSQRTTAKTAVVDCTKADAGKLEAIGLELAKLLSGDKPDWAAVEARAESAGVDIGGCALARVVSGDGFGVSSAPPEAKTTLTRFESKHAVTYHTARGDL